MAAALAYPEDVWAYNSDATTEQAREGIAAAERWVLENAPYLELMSYPPLAAREAVALLAAIHVDDKTAIRTGKGAIPNMVRLMILPWA